MAELTYNNVKIERISTVGYEATPVRSQDDVDLLYTKIHIDVIGIIDLSIDPGDNGIFPPGSISVDDIRTAMMRPRMSLSYSFDNPGNTGIVSPGNSGFPTNPPNPPNPPFPCDCQNGPLPDYCRIAAISGDKSAICYFGITTWLSECTKMLLSNRWQITEHRDREFYATRTIRGRLELRADIMNLNSGLFIGGVQSQQNADSFRRVVFPQCPAGFARDAIDMTVTSDGRSADYVLVDIEEPLAMGQVGYSEITRIEGEVTAGSEYITKSVTSFLTKAFSLDIGGLVGAAIPTPKAVGVCRVWGTRNATRDFLADVAIQILVDRFSPLGLNLPFGQRTTGIVSAYLTCNIAERMVEFRLEALVGVGASLIQTFSSLTDSFGKMLNLDKNEVQIAGKLVQGKLLAGDKSGSAYGFSNNATEARATSMVKLLNQVLGTNCTLPKAPPSPGPGSASDLNPF